MNESLHDAILAESLKVAELAKDGFKDVPLAVLQRAVARIATAAAPFTDWLTEPEAKLRSNRSTEWLRSQFAAWEAQGLARWNPARPKTRQYLRAVVPLRPNLSAAREAGRREVMGG